MLTTFDETRSTASKPANQLKSLQQSTHYLLLTEITRSAPAGIVQEPQATGDQQRTQALVAWKCAPWHSCRCQDWINGRSEGGSATSWMGSNHLGVSWNIEHRSAVVCVEQTNAQLCTIRAALILVATVT
jgi:hypothetical protein